MQAISQLKDPEDNSFSSLNLICRGALLSSWEQLMILLPTQQHWDKAMRRALDHVQNDQNYQATHETFLRVKAAQETRSASMPDLSRVSVCQHATPTTTRHGINRENTDNEGVKTPSYDPARQTCLKPRTCLKNPE